MGTNPQRAEVHGGSLTYRASLFQYIEPVIEANADHPAIIVAHQTPEYLQGFTVSDSFKTPACSSSTCLTWTYAQMQHAALKLVSSLQERGVGPGSTVVTLIPNGIEWALFLWSSILGKFTLCPLDAGALQVARATELYNLMSLLKPSAILVSGGGDEDAVDAVTRDQENSRMARLTLAAETHRAGWICVHDLAKTNLDQQVATRIITEARNDDFDRVQLIFFTSGTTTGQPKGCPRTVKSLMHTIEGQTWGSWNDSSARNMLQTANFRIIAPGVAIGSWTQGSCVVMPGLIYSPGAMLEAIARFKITMILLIPAMVYTLTAHPEFENIDLNSLRTVFIGGDIVTEGIYMKTCVAFPKCEVIVAHGSTEGGSAFTYETAGKIGPQSIPFHVGIAPLGKTQRGTSLRVANEQNEIMERGDTGELHFCSPSFVKYYLNGEQPHNFYTDHFGQWFKSGDMGFIDKEGWVYITSRKKDIIKRAGVPISPAALESCIDVFLQTQSGVLGVSHAQLGQEPFAVVRDLNGHSKEGVEKHVLDIFGKDYALAEVVTLQDLGLDTFPLNATGKIVKRELERPVAAFLGRTEV